MKQHKNPSIKYRAEIDGLRAVAVLPVILFHGGFDVFSGGFVGVDVFFVISGFLITSIILSDLEKGTFSVKKFYERRARRILPALFFVITACLPFAFAWMLPGELERFGESLVAVATFSANLFFWSTQEYFGPAAELQPMLHTWSLAVEEQYYVFVPLVLMWFWSLGRRPLFALIAAAAAGSLVIAEWGWRHEPTANFYLLPTRAWELLAGSLIAFAPSSSQLAGRGSAVLKQIGPYIGLGLILYSIFWFDQSIPIPSVYALIPVGGTVLIIASATPGHPVTRALAARPLVAIGLVSYSAYLWHQPLFAFARIRLLGEPSHWLAGGLAMLSLLLAYCSWRFVEAPFRSPAKKGISRAPLIPAVVSLGLLTATGLALYLSEGLPQRLPPDARAFIDRYDNYQDIDNGRFGECFFGEDHEQDDAIEFAQSCYGKPQAQRFVLIGDSFSAHYLSGLRSLLQPNETVAQFNISGCLPFVELPALTPARCRLLNGPRFDALTPEDVVILSAQWPAAIDQPESFEHQALATTLETLTSSIPANQIVLVGASPQWPGELPVKLIRAGLHKTLAPGDMLSNRTLEQTREINGLLSRMAQTYGVRFLDPVERLCEDSQCVVALAHQGGIEISASDYGHLTAPAARRVLSGLVGDIRGSSDGT